MHELAGLQGAFEHRGAAIPKQAHGGRPHRQIDECEEHREVQHGLAPGIRGFAIALRVARRNGRFTPERARRAHAAEQFGRIGVLQRELAAHGAVGALRVATEQHADEHDDRRRGDGEQRELEVEEEQDDQYAHDLQQVEQRLQHAVGDQFVEVLDVAGDARREFARRVLLVEREARAQQVIKQHAPHVADHALAIPGREQAKEVPEQRAAESGTKERGAVPKQGMYARFGCCRSVAHRPIDRVAQQPGPSHLQAEGDGEDHEAGDKTAPVRPHKRPQLAQEAELDAAFGHLVLVRIAHWPASGRLSRAAASV